MGQIFYSCVYDIEKMNCCVYDADKFHANCYSFSGSVFSIHYLLCQKPYHIMWGGCYVGVPEWLSRFSKKEDLLGLSTYLKYNESDLTDPQYNECLDKVKFIYDNSKCWKELNVWDDAEKYFNIKVNHHVKYENFLVNHTQKLAIDLTDYYNKSVSSTQNGKDYVVDPIPVLTETGMGAPMLFFDGISDETTEQLAGKWCGDLLQIVDKLPDDYTLINCCFAELRSKLNYCFKEFGFNEDGFLVKDDEEDLFKAVNLNLYGKRGPVYKFRVKLTNEYVEFIPEIS